MKVAGIDVGKAALDLAVDGAPGVRRFAKTEAGIGKLVRHLLTRADPASSSQRPAATRMSYWNPAAMPVYGSRGSTRARPATSPAPPASWPRPMPPTHCP